MERTETSVICVYTTNSQASLCVHMCSVCRCVCSCVTAYQFPFLFVYYAIMFVRLFACVSLLPPSSLSSAPCAQNEPPTTQRQRADGGFFIRLKDYIMILSALCTRRHTHTHINLVADGGRRHTCTHTHTHPHHTVTVSFKHVQSQQCSLRHTHACSLSLGTPPLSYCRRHAGPSVPRGRETERHRKRSVDPVMCVLVTPRPPVSSVCLHPPFPPQFQAANSAVCQLHSRSR